MKSLKAAAKLFIFALISVTYEIATAGVSPSLFHQFPEQIAVSMGHPYDPILASVMASLVSREPKRKKGEWRELQLGNEVFSSDVSAFFTAPVPVRFREGAGRGAPVFLIIPGSFATWKRGAFVNQTAATLDRVSALRPHLLTFPGLFSPEFLEGRCDQVPSDFDAIARDLYWRIRPLILLLDSPSVGIVGYSGGATVALRMAVIDRELFPDSPIFNAGVIASSPILDLHQAFRLLDHSYAKVQIPHDKGLTTADLENVFRKIKSVFKKNMNQQIFDFFDHAPEEFKGRFYNEFFTVDLAGVVKASGQDAFLKSGLPFTYSSFFEDYESLKPGELLMRSDLRPVLRAIEVPTLLHFPKDDPVLSKEVGAEKAPRLIDDILDVARENPNIQVVDPKTGGHTGLLLEPHFDLIFREFFFSRPRSTESSPKNNLPRD